MHRSGAGSTKNEPCPVKVTPVTCANVVSTLAQHRRAKGVEAAACRAAPMWFPSLGKHIGASAQQGFAPTSGERSAQCRCSHNPPMPPDLGLHPSCGTTVSIVAVDRRSQLVAAVKK